MLSKLMSKLMPELIVEVKVITRSCKSEIIKNNFNKIVAHIKSPPEKGKANKELIKLFSKKFKVPQYNILIVSGMTTTKKRLKVKTALTYEDLLKIIG